VLSSAKQHAPLSRERRIAGSESSAVVALPVTLEDEAPASGPPGMLSVTSLPPAHVVLDGRPVGMTPKLLPVSAGNHNVLFVHPELGRRTLSVSIESGAKSEAFNRF
jgi:serine/threonine-protein kinase